MIFTRCADMSLQLVTSTRPLLYDVIELFAHFGYLEMLGPVVLAYRQYIHSRKPAPSELPRVMSTDSPNEKGR